MEYTYVTPQFNLRYGLHFRLCAGLHFNSTGTLYCSSNVYVIFTLTNRENSNAKRITNEKNLICASFGTHLFANQTDTDREIQMYTFYNEQTTN